MAIDPQTTADASMRPTKARADDATDRPADERTAHRTRSAGTSTLDPDTNAPRMLRRDPVRAEVYRPPTPWALFARLSVLYSGVMVATTFTLVAGWWFVIGPTDDTPTPPETIVRVERVEVPVPGPAPAPEVIYVEVPAPAPPPQPQVGPKKRAPIASDVVVVPAKAAPEPTLATISPKVSEPIPAKVTPENKPAAPETPPAAAALAGAYSGKAGTAACTFDLDFLPERVVRAVVTLDQDGNVTRHTVTGQYDLARDGSATVALFVGDTAYTAIVGKGSLEGRLSQGGKNKGKVSARR